MIKQAPLRFLLFTLFCVSSLSAQHGLGTNTPNPSAALEIVSPDKGLLIPRMALTTSATFSPITGLPSSTHNGMLVYNTNTATETTSGSGDSNGLKGAGFYYWSGTTASTSGSWEKIGSSDTSIYTNDDSLTATRTVDLNNYLLNFESNSATPTLAIDGQNARVGIGTTTPTVPLQVIGEGGFRTVYISDNTTVSTTISQQGTTTLDDLDWAIASGGGYWYLNRLSDNSTLRSGANQFVIKDNGKVGIGTNDPKGALQITGINDGIMIPQISLTASATYGLDGTGDSTKNGMLIFNTNTSTNTLVDGLNGQGFYYWNGSAWIKIGSGAGGVIDDDKDTTILANDQDGSGTDSDTLEFQVAGAERMRIDAQGKIGIGTTSPLAALEVASNNNGLLIPRISLTASATYGLDGTGDSTKNGMLIFNTNTSTNTLVDGLNGQGFYYWNGSAWIKIGSGAGGVIDDDKDTTILANDQDGSGTDSDTLEFQVAGAERMRIDAQGKIGIGTTSPLAALEVASNDNGVLLPRLSLTDSVTMVSGIANVSSATNGLLLYNTNTATETTPGSGNSNGLKGAGYYYWSGTTASTSGSWEKIGSSDTSIYTNDDSLTATRTVDLNNYLLNFESNSATPTLAIDGQNARVGIGTTTPTVPLQVIGEGGFRTVYISDNTDVNTTISQQGTTTIDDLDWAVDSTNSYWYLNRLSDNSTLRSGTNQFVVTDDGKVGIGKNNPVNASTLDVNGDVYANGIQLTSDARYKTQIEELTDALDIVLQLRGVRHEWKSNAGKKFSPGTVLGLIAQEVEPYLPEVVRTDQDGYKSVDYTKLAPLLIEAIKSQQKQIDEQEERLNAIEKKLGIKTITN
ncbi:MAG: tail fiber domain-containing protein [Flavobacteriaceae bacterium]